MVCNLLTLLFIVYARHICVIIGFYFLVDLDRMTVECAIEFLGQGSPLTQEYHDFYN